MEVQDFQFIDTYLGQRVLGQTGIQNGIRDLVPGGVSIVEGEEGRGRTHAILSGWPSPTDSEVKRKVPGLVPLEREPIVTVVDEVKV